MVGYLRSDAMRLSPNMHHTVIETSGLIIGSAPPPPPSSPPPRQDAPSGRAAAWPRPRGTGAAGNVPGVVAGRKTAAGDDERVSVADAEQPEELRATVAHLQPAGPCDGPGRGFPGFGGSSGCEAGTAI